MSESNTSSPMSAASPRALAPAAPSPTNKPPVPMPTTILQTPSILRNKEWTIPPRPKPGRKPAADTPPTKRKAQNRAAQRAFRERRAAKQGDLEDQMKIMEQENEQEQEALRAQVKRLEDDVQEYNHRLVSFLERCKVLEKQLNEENQLRKNAEREVEILRMGQVHGSEPVPLPRRISMGTLRPNSAERLHLQSIEDTEPTEEVLLGCGNCSPTSRCSCIEEAFKMNDITTESSAPITKRPHSPSAHQNTPKRYRQDLSSEIKPEAPPTEIDFTAQFSRKPHPTLHSATTSSLTPISAIPDTCGFCQDGTPCFCAEAAANISPSTPTTTSKPTPSTGPQNSCINGPGTCPQCLSSPSSTLFCLSLAATRSSKAPSTLKSSAAHPASNLAITGPTLSCADAFTTLSRHPAFKSASDELEAWVPRLATVPGGVEGRTAFEVEAASVMGVLKFFDRRFGDERKRVREGEVESETGK